MALLPVAGPSVGGPGHRPGDERPSRANYLWALLGILGGLIGWLLVRDRDRALGRRVLITGGAVSVLSAALSVALYLALYSATENLAQSLSPTLDSTQPIVSTVTTTTLAPAVTVPAGALTKTWSFSATATGGYSMDGTVSVGRPQHYRKGLSNGTAIAGSACQVDTQTVGVVPATLSVTNTTKGFSEVLGVYITGLGTKPTTSTTDPENVQWEGQYSSGPACDGGSSTTSGSSFGVKSTHVVPPGGTVAISGFFVVTNYFSPNHPSGNVTGLARHVLHVPSFEDQSLTTGARNTYTVSAVSGPGVKEIDTFGDAAWLFTLTGAAPATSAPAIAAPGGSITQSITTTPPATVSTGTGATGTVSTGTAVTGT